MVSDLPNDDQLPPRPRRRENAIPVRVARRPSTTVALLLLCVGVALGADHRWGAAPPNATVTATPPLAFTPVTVPMSQGASHVGPLFPQGLSGSHTCTASVVTSSEGDVLITAAHCLTGDPTGMIFAPGYISGVAPYGTWVVVADYASSSWSASQDPKYDYAFLDVVPSPSNPAQRSVQQVVGSSGLTTAPASGQVITAQGYPEGTGGSPITCTTTVREDSGAPAFDCDGFVAGTSGGPWLTQVSATSGDTLISAVTGGPHLGGCSASTSYASAFTEA
jgi:V8-like Glu-specific endopeptidase